MYDPITNVLRAMFYQCPIHFANERVGKTVKKLKAVAYCLGSVFCTKLKIKSGKCPERTHPCVVHGYQISSSLSSLFILTDRQTDPRLIILSNLH